MRSNIEAARLSECMLGEKNRYLINKMTLAGTFTMDDDMVPWHFLDPGGAARSVLLPVETKGLWFVIANQADANEDLTVREDSNTTTIAIVPAGSTMMFISDGTSWEVLGVAGGGGGGVVNVTDAATYTVLRGNSGRVHAFPNLTADIVVTLPPAEEGLNYEFIYVGAANDAQDWRIDAAAATDHYKGGVVHLDSDAGAAADELVTVYANGSSNVDFVVLTPEAGTSVQIWSDGTFWYITGRVVSISAPSFAD